MTHPGRLSRRQFRIRSVLGMITWAALLLAICVQHQRASRHQRLVHEHRMTLGFPPFGPVSTLSQPTSFPQRPFPTPGNTIELQPAESN